MGVRRIIRAMALAGAVCAIGLLPTAVAAQGGPNQNRGTLTVVVTVVGDAGGNGGAVSWVATRNTTTGANTSVVNGAGSTSAPVVLDQGAWNLGASVSDPAYVITEKQCGSNPPNQGPGQADFTVTGGGAVTCTITVRYTAAPPDSTTPASTTPASTTPASTTPAGTTPVATEPVVTATTIAQGALAPSGAAATPTGTIPLTGPTGETPAIALTALGLLLIGGGSLALARRH